MSDDTQTDVDTVESLLAEDLDRPREDHIPTVEDVLIDSITFYPPQEYRTICDTTGGTVPAGVRFETPQYCRYTVEETDVGSGQFDQVVCEVRPPARDREERTQNGAVYWIPFVGEGLSALIEDELADVEEFEGSVVLEERDLEATDLVEAIVGIEDEEESDE